MFDPIKPIHFVSNLVLPETYGDAISYYEDLQKMRFALNQTIDAYNTLIDYYNSLDGLLNEFKSEIANIEGQLADMLNEQEAFEAKINADFASLSDSLKDDIDSQINALNQNLQAQIALQNEYLQAQIVILNRTINEKDAATRVWVERELHEFELKIPEFQNVVVIDPRTGKPILLQDMVNTLYTLMGASMFDPVTGRAETFRDVIRANTDLHRVSGNLSAQEYDDMHITAGEYDAMHLTAWQFDWAANRYLTGGDTI